jgi:hypothetical protein
VTTTKPPRRTPPGRLAERRLLAFLPAALDIADGDLGAAAFLRLIERWRRHANPAAAARATVKALARSHRHVRPDRFADRVMAALAAPRLGVRRELARAMAGHIPVAAAQSLLLCRQRRAWQRRIGGLLLAGPRVSRAKKPTSGVR